MCCVRKYEKNGSHLPCPRNFLIARKYLRRQAMMSLRSISARFRFLLSKVKPISFISLHKVVFVKFGKSSSSLTALLTLSSVGISLLAYMLCTFRRMAWIVKLSCLTVRELEIFTSRARFFGDTKGPRLQFRHGTGRYSSVLAHNTQHFPHRFLRETHPGTGVHICNYLLDVL